MKCKLLFVWSAALRVLVAPILAADALPLPVPPVKVIFDTDIGNDVDDVLALSILHALQTRHDCELLAVTVTKSDELAGPFVDAINTFYGRPDIPIACLRPLPMNQPSKFLRLAEVKDAEKLRFPHKLMRGSDAPEPSQLLRRILGRQPDNSVVLIQVGFFSDYAALLETSGDADSPLGGIDLVRRKVRLLSVMAGSFKVVGGNNHFLEFNVINDVRAAQKLARDWPTPIVWSGYEIGVAVPYPAASIQRDYAYTAHHPTAEAYRLYNPPPHERPTWDLTSALFAVFPDRGYFNLSPPGLVTVEDDGFTRFTPKPDGRDRYLILEGSQAVRVKEAFVQLASEPPSSLPGK